MLTVTEDYWRSQGHLPAVTDDMLLWSYSRSRVYSEHGVKRIAIVGSSRSQLGIVPGVLDEDLPSYRAVHLAVDGAGGYATFQNLAEDESFDGVIIFDTTAKNLLPADHTAQRPWIEFYERTWSNYGWLEKVLNLKIRLLLQSHLASLTSALSLREEVFSGFKPLPSYASMMPNRYRPAYYFERMTAERRQEHREWRLQIVETQDKPPTPEQEKQFVETLTHEVSNLVAKLRARGGNVVFVRMPTCGRHWQIDEVRYPKRRFWDKIRELTGAEAIHFADVPGLADFDCPDTSHLDATDAPIFTRRLAAELKVRGIVSEGSGQHD